MEIRELRKGVFGPKPAMSNFCDFSLNLLTHSV